MADVGAIVAAAGRGNRLGAGKNKLFLPLLGKAILAYTLEALENCPDIGGIVVAVGQGEEEECRRLVADSGFGRVEAVLAGGPTRQESVGRALKILDHGYSLVAVQDGARPFTSPALISSVAHVARTSGAAIPGIPLKDTVKILRGPDRVGCTLPREELIAVQTPQVFSRAVLEDAYARAALDGFSGTDDSLLVERLGFPIQVVPGEYRNFKITTREDLELAEAYLSIDCALLGT